MSDDDALSKSTQKFQRFKQNLLFAIDVLMEVNQHGVRYDISTAGS